MASYAVSDASDQSADPHLWARGFFGTLSIGDGEPHPHHGPAFGGGADVPMSAARGVGEDNYYVMSSIGGLSDEEIAAAEVAGSVGAALDRGARAVGQTPEQYATRMERGELSRVDARHDRWREVAP